MLVKAGRRSAFRMQRIMKGNLRYYEVEKFDGDHPARPTPHPTEPIKMLSPITVPSVTTALTGTLSCDLKPWVNICLQSSASRLLRNTTPDWLWTLSNSN